MLNRLFGSLGWLGSILVFTAVAIWFVRPDLEQLRRVLAFAGLASILLYLAGQWRQVARSFERRQTRYGTLAGTGVVLVLAIIVALNYVLARQNTRWDLTAAQQYSLSDQTQRVLEGLESPIRILVFAREPEFPRYRDRLDEYAYLSSQVTVDYVDVDRQPMLARQYEVQSYGTIVFDYEGRVERVVSDAEQDLTNGLITVIEGKQQTVYFLEGHGEKEHTGADRDGYQRACWNINFPDLPVAELRGSRFTRQIGGGIAGPRLVHGTDGRGLTYHWLSFERRPSSIDHPQSDVVALRDGHISVMPLQPTRCDDALADECFQQGDRPLPG